MAKLLLDLGFSARGALDNLLRELNGVAKEIPHAGISEGIEKEFSEGFRSLKSLTKGWLGESGVTKMPVLTDLQKSEEIINRMLPLVNMLSSSYEKNGNQNAVNILKEINNQLLIQQRLTSELQGMRTPFDDFKDIKSTRKQKIREREDLSQYSKMSSSDMDAELKGLAERGMTISQSHKGYEGLLDAAKAKIQEVRKAGKNADDALVSETKRLLSEVSEYEDIIYRIQAIYSYGGDSLKGITKEADSKVQNLMNKDFGFGSKKKNFTPKDMQNAFYQIYDNESGLGTNKLFGDILSRNARLYNRNVGISPKSLSPELTQLIKSLNLEKIKLDVEVDKSDKTKIATQVKEIQKEAQSAANANPVKLKTEVEPPKAKREPVNDYYEHDFDDYSYRDDVDNFDKKTPSYSDGGKSGRGSASGYPPDGIDVPIRLVPSREEFLSTVQQYVSSAQELATKNALDYKFNFDGKGGANLKQLLDSIKNVKINKSTKDTLTWLGENASSVLKPFSGKKDFSSVSKLFKSLNSLDIKKSSVNNLESVMTTIVSSIASLQGEDIRSILSPISELLSKADALSNLATVVKSSAKNIENAKKDVDNSSNTKKEFDEEKFEKDSTKKLDEYYRLKYKTGALTSNQNDFYTNEDNTYKGIKKELEQKLKDAEKVESILNKLLEKKKDIEQKYREAREEKQVSKYGKSVGTFKSSSDAIDSLKAKGITVDSMSTSNTENGIVNITAKTEIAKGKFKEMQYVYDQVTGAMYSKSQKVTTEMTKMGSLAKLITSRWKAMIGYFATFGSFYKIIDMGRRGLQIIRDLDLEFTEMRKVSDETTESLKKFAKQSFNIAEQIGTTGKEIQSSTADFMKLGYSINEASKLAENANIYKNVGDMNIDEATKHMISSIKAFGGEFNSEVEASTALIDKYNEVGNNFAITSADIGEGMERASAALVAAGNNTDQSLGLLTAGNLIQQDADTVANALKVVSLRIRGSETELEAMGESTDDLSESTSKLREELKGLTSVDIMLDDSTYKSTYDILLELSKVWDNLDDVSQANVLEKLAGKTRSSIVAGLVKNMDTAEEVVETAANSEGSALRENERILESVGGHINILTSKWQELWSGDGMKETVKYVASVLSFLTDILNTLGGMDTILPGIILLFAKMKGNIGIFSNNKDDYENGFRPFAHWSRGAKSIGELWRGTGKTINGFDKITSNSEFGDIIQRRDIEAFGLLVGESGIDIPDEQMEELNALVSQGKLEVSEYTKVINRHNNSLEVMGAQAKITATGMKLLKSALAVGTEMAIMWAIGKFIEGINNYINRFKIAQEETESLFKTFNEGTKELSSNTKSLESQKEEFERLSKGVSEYGENISLTSEEYDKYKSIVAEILGYTPDLIAGYDEEGNAIARKNNLLERSIELMEEERKAKLEEMLSDENVDKQAKAAIGDYKDAKDKALKMNLSGNTMAGINYLKNYLTTANPELLKKVSDENGKIDLSSLFNNYFDEIDWNAVKNTEIEFMEKTYGYANRDVINENINAVKEYFKYINSSQYKNRTKSFNDTLSLYAQSADGYENLTAEQSAFINDYIEATGSVTDENGKIKTEDQLKEDGEKIRRFVESFANSTYSSTIEDIYKLDKTTMPAEVYEQKINDILNSLDNIKDENGNPIFTEGVKKQIKISLGFNFVNDTQTSVQEMLNTIRNDNKTSISDDLSGSWEYDDLKIVYNIVVDEVKAGKYDKNGDGKLDDEEIKEAILTEKEVTLDIDILPKMTSASSGISSLASAFDEIATKGYITTQTLTAIKEATKLSGDEWEIYKKKLLKAKSGSAEFDNVLKDMTYKILENTFGTEGLANATEEEVALVLKENGVLNANAVAHEAVMTAKAKEKIQSQLLKGVTKENISALLEDADTCGIAADAYIYLVMQEIIFNNNSLDVSQKLQALRTLAEQAGLTGAAISSILNAPFEKDAETQKNWAKENGFRVSAKKDKNGNIIYTKNSKGEKVEDWIWINETTGATYENANEAALAVVPSAFQKELPNYKGTTSPKYSSETANKNAEDAAKKAEEAAEKAKQAAIDALNKRIEVINHELGLLSANLDILSNRLDMTFEGDYITKMQTMGQQFMQASQYSNALRVEIRKLLDTMPANEEEAEIIASQLEKLGDSFYDNQRKIIEYREEIAAARVDMINAMNEADKASLDSISNTVERTFDIMENGSITGGMFATAYTPTTVEMDTIEAQRAENDALLEEEKSFRDIIAEVRRDAFGIQQTELLANNEFLKTQIAETNVQLESNIFDSTEKNKNQISDTNEQILTDVTEAGDDLELEVDTTANNVVSTIQDAADNIANTTFKAPSLDTVSWDNFGRDIKKKLADAFVISFNSADYASTESGDPDYPLGSDDFLGKSAPYKILSAAKKYKGTRYVWGGTNASTDGGLDCSGFVYNVLRDAGFPVTRTTAEGFKTYGYSVKPGQQQMGDLLFFEGAEGGGAGHIGIYIGNGMMIDSGGGGEKNTRNNPGQGVRIVPVRGDLTHVKRVTYHAEGTQDYGIAGENYKKEWMIDKHSGEWFEINSPTLFNKKDYDIVGEELSTKLDKPIDTFADGTLTNQELLGYIKKASEETGVPANILAALIQQESQGKWVGKIWDVNNYSYGYTQLHDGSGAIAQLTKLGMGDLAQKAKTDKYSNVLAGAEFLKYLKSLKGDWQSTLTSYNGSGSKAREYGRTVYNRSQTSEYKNLLNSLSSIEADVSTIAEEPEITVEKLEDILKEGVTISDINAYLKKDYENILVNSDKRKNAQFYELEKKYNANTKSAAEQFRNYLETTDIGYGHLYSKYDDKVEEQYFADNDVAIGQAQIQAREAIAKSQELQKRRLLLDDMYSKATTPEEQEKIIEAITSTNDQLADVQKIFDDAYSKIFQAEQNKVSSSDGDYTNSLSYINKNLERLIDEYGNAEGSDKLSLANKVLSSYSVKEDFLTQRLNNAITGMNSVYDNADEPLKELLDNFKLQEVFDADGEFNNNYKETLSTIQSVFGGEAVKAYDLAAKIYQLNLKNYKETNDELLDIHVAIEDFKKEESTKIDSYLKIQEELVKTMEHQVKKGEMKYNAQSSLYSFQQELERAKLDANLEVEANKELEEWLDPESRKLLFNEEDLSSYISEIDSINAELEETYKNYEKDIANLDPEEMWKADEIAMLYEHDIAQLKERLEVSRQELNIAKKTLEYNNAAKERDTQIIMGNRIVNVADPERMHQLATEKIQLENEKSITDMTHQNNERLRDTEAINASIQSEANAIQSRIDMINNMTEKEREAFEAALPSQNTMDYFLAALGGTAMRELTSHMNDFMNTTIGFNRDDLGNSFHADVDYSELQQKLEEDFTNGKISKEVYEWMKPQLEYLREEKSSTIRKYEQYDGGIRPNVYGNKVDESLDAEFEKKLSQATTPEDFQKLTEEIVNNANLTQGGRLSKYDEQMLQSIEAKSNKILSANGEFYKQTNEYGGAITMSSDFRALMDEIIADAKKNNDGVLSNEQLDVLRRYETMRNMKIFASGSSEKQTNEYGGDKFNLASDIQSITEVFERFGKLFGYSDFDMNALTNLETMRNLKVFALGENPERFGKFFPSEEKLNQTYKYGGKNFGKYPDKQSEYSARMIKAAYDYLGTPYVFNGSDIDKDGGLDSSGLIYKVLSDIGISVKRDTNEYYSRGGEKIENKKDLKPGDVVFWNADGNRLTSGIYIGDNTIYRASEYDQKVISQTLPEDIQEMRRYTDALPSPEVNYKELIDYISNRDHSMTLSDIEMMLNKYLESGRNHKIFYQDANIDQTDDWDAEYVGTPANVEGNMLLPVNEITPTDKLRDLTPEDYTYPNLFDNLANIDGNINLIKNMIIPGESAKIAPTGQGSTITYTFGDIVITKPMKSGAELFKEFSTKLEEQHATTNNMSN